MFLFKPVHFLKFWGKSQPQRSYKNGSYKIKRVYTMTSRKFVPVQPSHSVDKYIVFPPEYFFFNLDFKF